MSSFREFVKRHALPFYYGLVFLISWGGGLLAVGPRVFFGFANGSLAFNPVFYIVVIPAPLVAGLFAIGMVRGRSGFTDLRVRLTRARVGAQWWLMALLTAPAGLMGILLATSAFSPAFFPEIFTTGGAGVLVIVAIIAGLATSFCEEIGWTGFAVPEFRKRLSVVWTGLVMGIVWGLWHFPMFAGTAASASGVAPALVLVVLLFSWLPAFRILMVWLYDRTQSLLVTWFMHAALVASQFVITPASISGIPSIEYDLAFAAVLWTFAAVVWAQGRIRASPVVNSKSNPPSPQRERSVVLKEALLLCGILSGLFYAIMDALGGLQWTHYSWVSEEFSRLSSVGAPSRPIILALSPVFCALVIAFGIGLWWSAGGNRGQRVIAGALVGFAVVSWVWPQFYPEDVHASVSAFTNTMHIVLTAVTVTCWIVVLGVATASNRGWFRLYSIGTIGTVLVFGGLLSGSQGAAMAAGQPHPWLGLVERINIYGFYVWMSVLALMVIQRLRAQSSTVDSSPKKAGLKGMLPDTITVSAHMQE